MTGWWLLGLCLALASCAETDWRAHADRIAAPVGLQREQIQTQPFLLTAYSRISQPGTASLHVYIEGDGLAWFSRSEPSHDPTPHQALGLELAAADASPNVVYLARPCQFTPMNLNPDCGIRWWTSLRYAPTVISAMNQAIDQLVRRAPGQPLELIGYSGGGALAILLAAQRHDVASIRTVAGNLDTEYVNQIHDVSAMPDSANPAAVARQTAQIAQLHFSGASDSVVPPAVATRFATAAGGTCIHTEVVNGLSHSGDWAARWPALLAQTPRCGPLNPQRPAP